MKNYKKHMFIGTATIGLLLIPPAYSAVSKCVKLTTGMTFSEDVGGYHNLVATNSAQGWTVPVEIVSLCGNYAGRWPGYPHDYPVNYGSYASDNKYCFCRLVSPAVSKWVYVGQINLDCARGGCELRCRDVLMGTSSDLTATEQTTIRNNLLSYFETY